MLNKFFSITNNHGIFSTFLLIVFNPTNQEKIKVKVIVPLENRKDTKKIKVMAMVKGQIQSEVVDVQKEFDKNGGYTIERVFHLTEIQI